MKSMIVLVCLFAALLEIVGCGKQGGTEPILVFAAASLGGPLDTLAARFEAQAGQSVKIAYGASGVLAQQIRMGAQADVFVSADTGWVMKLASDPDSLVESWRPFLNNRLVLVTGSDLDYRTRDLSSLESPAITRIAIANPETAPAGRYATAYMQRTGVYDRVRSKLVIQEDVRAVSQVVRLSVVDVGFIYATDLVRAADLRLVEIIPDSLYPPIVYGIALLQQEGQTRGQRLYEYFASDEAIPAYRDAGFEVDSSIASE